MARPTFGPDRQTLGHPATTRYLDNLMTEEERQAEKRRLAGKLIVDAEIQAWLDRQESIYDRASRKVG